MYESYRPHLTANQSGFKALECGPYEFATQLTVSERRVCLRDGINTEVVPRRDGISGTQYRMSQINPGQTLGVRRTALRQRLLTLVAGGRTHAD